MLVHLKTQIICVILKMNELAFLERGSTFTQFMEAHMNAQFYSKLDLYGSDHHYHIVKRTPTNEFKVGYHYHDFYEATFYHSTGGDESNGMVRIRDKEYVLRSGSMVLISAFDPHEVVMKSSTEYVRYSMNFDLDFLLSSCSENSNISSIFSEGCHNYPIMQLTEKQQDIVLDIFSRMENCPIKQGQDIYNRALLYETMSVLYDFFYAPDMYAGTNMQYVEMISTIVKYIETHIGEDLSLNTIAEKVNYSPSYTSRIFHKLTGETLNKYTASKRIDRAKLLLSRGDISLMDISKAVGFENYNHFFRAFRKITGSSPSEYKREKQLESDDGVL